MSAKKQDLLIEQGATFEKRFIWQDENGVAIDVSGYTAQMQIRPSADSETLLLELTTGNNRISLDASGHVDLLIAAADTATLDFETAVYELILITGDIVVRLARGAVRLCKAIIR